MRVCSAVPICVLVLCPCLSAQAQSNTEVSAETNPTIDAVDASVRPEVDGQPHEPTQGETSREGPTTLRILKRPPATVVWPARADLSTTYGDGKTGPPGVGMSSFRPRMVWGQPSAWQPNATATSNGATNDDSGQDHFRLLNAPPSHPLSLSAKPTLNPRTMVSPVSGSDQTSALGAPFGRAGIGLGAITSPFPKRDSSKYKDQTGKKRHQHHSGLPVTTTATWPPLSVAGSPGAKASSAARYPGDRGRRTDSVVAVVR